MHTTRFFPIARAPFQALLGAAFALYACSFQDFDYLQKGPAAEGGADTGGQTQTGGRDNFGGTGGGSQGGTSGAKSSEGGKPASGGVSAGGAGTMAGAGGEGEQGGEGGGAVAGGGGAGGQGPGTGGVVGTAGDGGVGNIGTAGSGGDGPVLVGNLLTNPSFEVGLTGWTVDPASAVTPNRYVYTQPPQGSGTTVDGSQELAIWHMTAEYEFSIYQVVKKLTPGTYSLKGNFSSQLGREAYLFARNCGGAERQMPIPHDSFPWFEVAIPDIEVSASSCEVGFFVHNLGNDWMNADMFTFEKVP